MRSHQCCKGCSFHLHTYSGYYVFALVCLLFGASATQGCGGTVKGAVGVDGVVRLRLTLGEVKSTVEAWAKAASNRDIDAIVRMHDVDIIQDHSSSRVLGLTDEANSARRTTLPLIRDHFNSLLGGNDAVKPNFPKFDAADVIFLAEDTAAYSGYYNFELTKTGVTKEVFAKFTYILKKTPNGVKIVTHNSLITPKGAVPRKLQANGLALSRALDGKSPVTEAARHLESTKGIEYHITYDDVRDSMRIWKAAVSARNIDATVSLYHPEMGRLLGTVDEATSPRRNTPQLIREYYEGFLGGNGTVKLNFPKFDASDVIFLADDTAAYSGYYSLTLAKDGVTKDVYAKFTYVLRKAGNGLKIVLHNTGLTPTGAVLRKKPLLAMWRKVKDYFSATGYANAGEIFPEDGLLMDEGLPVQKEFLA